MPFRVVPTPLRLLNNESVRFLPFHIFVLLFLPLEEFLIVAILLYTFEVSSINNM